MALTFIVCVTLRKTVNFLCLIFLLCKTGIKLQYLSDNTMKL